MKEPTNILAAAILLHALVQVVTGIIGLRIAKTLHGFGMQLAQYGRSTRVVPVAPARPPEPPEPPPAPPELLVPRTSNPPPAPVAEPEAEFDPFTTTADALKSETLQLFELERARKAREGEGP